MNQQTQSAQTGGTGTNASSRREALVYLGLSLLWMAVIFAFSHQAYSGRITEEYLGDANIPVRKLGHVSEFGVLSLLYLKTILSFFKSKLVDKTSKGSEISFKTLARFALLALFLAFLYALSDEWHQAFVPGRSSSFIDVLVDTSGMVIALGGRLGLSWFGRRQELKKDPSAR
jgi:VanZ family protein